MCRREFSQLLRLAGCARFGGINPRQQHLPDTPLPWDSGNSALAAHRDTYFRLKNIKAGDIVRLSTPHGRFDYRVRETMVVSPEDVWVLDPTDRPTVTLITCYPFSYVGHDPQRFIVRAERVGGAQQRRT